MARKGARTGRRKLLRNLIAVSATATFADDFGVDDYSHDRLGFAFCLALALHAAFILGVGFTREDRQVAAPRIEITLAQHRSETAPEEADFLAQNNQEGSGTLEEKAMLTTRELADFQDNTIREVTPQQQLKSSQTPRSAEQLLTASRADTRTAEQQREPQESAEEMPLVTEDAATIQRSLEIASLEAKLEIQRQAYAKRPRIRRLTSLATKQSDDALYLHNWREKIEAIGNENYPLKAKQQNLYGSLRLVVSLLPNGDVHQVRILQSSGHAILDQAAIRIVHLAAPFDPFPQKMQKNVDVLEIIRTWRFHKDKLTSST